MNHLKVVTTQRQPELDFQAQAQELVARRNEHLCHALSLYERAEEEYKFAQKALDHARQRRDEARAQLTHLVGRDEKLLVGNVLLTRHANGGLHIESVSVVGLV
ncbi:MAG TPA: hypothetical protein VHE37_12090 [Nevskiaceae bacterium]|nr:hypothetical protein [Nevskiaceae bacterium]